MKSKISYWALLSLFTLIFFQNIAAQTAEQEAAEMLNLVNALRTDRGLTPLRLNTELNLAAYDHSNDMATNDYFSHTGLNGSNFSQRAIAAGYTGSPRGENIAAGNAAVLNTFNQWVNSSGHLNNMLNPNANEMGIGHAFFNASTYRHYWTQILGKGSEVLSVDDYELTENIEIYPNPVKETLRLQLTGTAPELLELKLVSITGQVVYKKHTAQFQSEIDLELGQLSPGIYMLLANNIQLEKIIKL